MFFGHICPPPHLAFCRCGGDASVGWAKEKRQSLALCRFFGYDNGGKTTYFLLIGASFAAKGASRSQVVGGELEGVQIARGASASRYTRTDTGMETRLDIPFHTSREIP